jgi:RimJ/RimL family protein N-acetyltransferase
LTRHGTDGVRLVEMDDPSYRDYRESLIRDYAADKVRAGVWSKDEAEDKSADDVDDLLPEGPATPDHYLYSVRDEALPAEVGVLWISPRDTGVGRSVFVYDIVVHEQFRRRGYARRILKLAEDRAIELGANKIELQVFGHNHAARALYEKTGYETTSMIMAKQVIRKPQEYFPSEYDQ